MQQSSPPSHNPHFARPSEQYLRHFLVTDAQQIQPVDTIVAKHNGVPRRRMKLQFITTLLRDPCRARLEGVPVQATRGSIGLEGAVKSTPAPL